MYGEVPYGHFITTGGIPMNTTNVINRKAITAKSLTIAAAIATAVLLPQLFHAIGAISGTGAALGSALLPMHIPVLLAGYLGGPFAGLIAGVSSPLVSCLLTGMPAEALLPFMVIELGLYGLVSGMLSRTRLHAFVQLLLTQIAGRAARALAVLAAIYLFGNHQLGMSSVYTFITAGLFGILLQWALIPLLGERMKGFMKQYE